jgi:hypothetical protein
MPGCCQADISVCNSHCLFPVVVSLKQVVIINLLEGLSANDIRLVGTTSSILLACQPVYDKIALLSDSDWSEEFTYL